MSNTDPARDDARISALLAQSERAERKPIQQEQAQFQTWNAWRAYEENERHRRLFFNVYLPMLAVVVAGSVFFTYRAVKRLREPVSTPAPEKPSERVLRAPVRNAGPSGAQATFDREGRIQSVSF